MNLNEYKMIGTHIRELLENNDSYDTKNIFTKSDQDLCKLFFININSHIKNLKSKSGLLSESENLNKEISTFQYLYENKSIIENDKKLETYLNRFKTILTESDDIKKTATTLYILENNDPIGSKNLTKNFIKLSKYLYESDNANIINKIISKVSINQNPIKIGRAINLMSNRINKWGHNKEVYNKEIYIYEKLINKFGGLHDTF